MLRTIQLVCFVLLVVPICSHAILPITPPTHPRHTINVDDGNVGTLIDAINEANDTKFSGYVITIELAGNFQFSSEDYLPSIQNHIRIVGSANLIGGGASEASVSGDKEGPSQLFKVDIKGQLELELLEFVDFSLNHDELALIENHGTLSLRFVEFTSTYSHGHCSNTCTPQMPILYNAPEAKAILNQVSIVGSGTTMMNSRSEAVVFVNDGDAEILNSQFFFPGPGNEWSYGVTIDNNGSLEILYSTFWYDGDAGITRQRPIAVSFGGVSASVHASIFKGYSERTCEYLTSAGYNLIDNVDCAWSTEHDLVGIDPHLTWKPTSVRLVLDYAAVPAPYSRAVDSVPLDPWNSVDLLGKMRTNVLTEIEPASKIVSDRGAVEAWITDLSEGGINGLYYNPEADGHYIQIQQTDYLTLVIWNTYDERGEQAWVYGTGQLSDDGTSVTAETYINRNVDITPDASSPEVKAEFWGTLEVKVESCMKGWIKFDSIDPNFGNGEFQIERLAFVKQLGCMN